VARLRGRKAQAVAEMAIFGSLILLVFGAMLSYLQRGNDQQHVEMEAFRQALKAARTPPSHPDEGASAQYTLIETRKHVDLSGNFRKGSTQTFSASSSVFWAVPVGEPQNVVVYRINDDEIRGGSELALGGGGGTDFADNSVFHEQYEKQETPSAITTTRTSQLQETVTTNIDGVGQVKQGAYLGSDGQYHYSKDHVGTVINRGRKWQTEF